MSKTPKIPPPPRRVPPPAKPQKTTQAVNTRPNKPRKNR